jgi:hypothetical protein
MTDREFFRRFGTAILIVVSAIDAYMMAKCNDVIGLTILLGVFIALLFIIHFPFSDEVKKG